MTEDVALAYSELRSLITKAARGAGMSWGLAEEAGWAAEWLARRGLPAADWAALWLAACIDGKPGPVEVGVLQSDDPEADLPREGRALPDGLVAPGYLLPFLHRLALVHGTVAIVSDIGTVVALLPDGSVRFGPCWQSQSRGWKICPTDLAKSERTCDRRPRISRSVLECLEGLALATTVPPSETSRRDAGSTGGDND